MKNFSLAFTFFLVVACIVACNDNTTNVTETTGMALVEKGAKAPDCTGNNAGEMIYMADSAAAFFCADGKWQSLKGEKGEQGLQGEPGEGKQGPQGLKGENGNDGVGTPGEAGKTCTAKILDNGKGYKIECGGDSVGVVLNGNDGVGTEGKSCEGMLNDDGSISVSCGGQFVGTIHNGLGCTSTDKGDGVVSIRCGDVEPVVIYKAMCGDKPYDPATQFCVVRDDRAYKFVEIGSQTWMAENLNYETATGSFCYGDTDEEKKQNCTAYGRLYTWATAVGKTEDECGYGHHCELGTGLVQGVCPDGWHLPTNDEWNALLEAVGGASVAGVKLKAAKDWSDDGYGTDDYFFTALPSGHRDGNGPFQGIGDDADFWSSAEDGENFAYRVDLYKGFDEARLNNNYKTMAFSVRCVKNKESDKFNVYDRRNGKVYRKVTIGSQTWMAENLNFETAAGSYCYGTTDEEKDQNCATYGRLYTWATAVGKSEAECGYEVDCDLGTGKIQGVCPKGWHLPQKEEWEELLTTLGEEEIGKKLKSKTAWDDYTQILDDGSEVSISGNGEDLYGYNALPAGHGYDDGTYKDEGINIHFWSSSRSSAVSAYNLNLRAYDTGYKYLGVDYKHRRFSVRCIED